MTRETKIGLLVGLAFIIVIGILLSDHLTSSTEPPPATLANAGSNVMQALNSPGSANTAPVTRTAPPQHVTPSQPVPTRADLTPQPQPVQIVQIGPGSGRLEPSPVTVQVQQPQTMQQPFYAGEPVEAPPVITMPQPLPAIVEAPADDSPIITHLPPSSFDRSLAQVAQHNGEALVALDTSGRPVPLPNAATAVAWTQSLRDAREHKAEPGDSVSRMAARFMGGNTRANREAIVRANASLQADPDKVIVGHTYLIPTSAVDLNPVASTSRPLTPPVLVQPSVDTSTGRTIASATEYFYTVKEGDSLWKIANDQLGKPGAVAAIKELNKDTIRGDIVIVGQKIRLPGRPVAQAD
jgi:LysM repeat protein